MSQGVSLWGYTDSAEGDERSTLLKQSEHWQQFLPKIQPLIHTQQNRILKPTRFSPIR